MTHHLSSSPETATPKTIVAGSEIVVDVLRWNEGWEFDCPVCILRPVVRFSPNGDDAEQMVENLAIDAAVTGHLQSTEVGADGVVDKQYPLKALKRRWAANRRGVQFPRLQYSASRFRVRFIASSERDAEPGELTFTVEKL
jgi:hypothetical protein